MRCVETTSVHPFVVLSFRLSKPFNDFHEIRYGNSYEEFVEQGRFS